MRISDCSSYVCSSDLSARRRGQDLVRHQAAALARAALADAHVGRTQVRTIAAMLDNRPTAPSWSGDADAFVLGEEDVKIFVGQVAVQSVIQDRKSVVLVKSVSLRVHTVGCRFFKK